jgi:hypothetical protein
MALAKEEHPSRWSIFIEVRDAIRSVLAPSLLLSQVIKHGKRIAAKASVRRPARPLQTVALTRLFRRF